jgi:hypothetical protein
VTDDEIPGPRSGGGPGEEPEEDYDATWDNISGEEMLDHLEEDTLIDAITEGVQGNLGEDKLAELIARLRDRVDETAIPVPNLGKTERGENVVPPKRGESVSISDDAAQLAAVAGSTAVQGMLQQAQSDVQDGLNIALGAMGSNHTMTAEVNGAGSAAVEAIATALAHVEAFYSAVGGAAAHLR